MKFTDFLQEMLRISNDFYISKIENEEDEEKVITTYLKYSKTRYYKDGDDYSLYDKMQERKWQHLSWERL